jgi:hypothetical protein
VSESSYHLRLVERILLYVKESYHGLYSLALLHDMPAVIGAEKPPRVRGFVPDVYAVDAPLTTMIIGEAKTSQDLLTEHSLKQIGAFLSHLEGQKRGVFVLSVPWQAARRGQSLVTSICRTRGIDQTKVELVILDGVKREARR